MVQNNTLISIYVSIFRHLKFYIQEKQNLSKKSRNNDKIFKSGLKMDCIWTENGLTFYNTKHLKSMIYIFTVQKPKIFILFAFKKEKEKNKINKGT